MIKLVQINQQSNVSHICHDYGCCASFFHLMDVADNLTRMLVIQNNKNN